MQTFLPFADFEQCATVLDDKRLYKQIVECKQILNVLKGHPSRWHNHPAILMWKGYEDALRYYQWCMFKEWALRRWKFNVASHYDDIGEVKFPEWLGTVKLHKSHQQALLAKDPDHYIEYFELEEQKIDYWWPIKKGETK